MASNATILPAAEPHYEAIAHIYNEYVGAANATTEETPKTAADIAQWCGAFNQREGLYVLLLGGQPQPQTTQKVAGWGIIKRYSNREGYRYTCETAIYLTEAMQGMGYGTQMKHFLIEECRAMGYHHLVAKILASNHASIQYNLKLGYTLVGTQKEVSYLNGAWHDVVIMQKLL